MIYSEFNFYSPILDSDALRISSSDSQGGEFFVIVAKPATGRSVRELREKSLRAIESAIESGLDPGEVHLKGYES